MSIPIAPDSPLTRAAAHLHAAGFLAADRAGDDGDEMLSSWANTADSITLAAMGLAPHFTGPLEPVQHPDCCTALLAAADELARLRPGVDAPLADLMFVLEFLLPALRHARDDTAGAAPDMHDDPAQSGQP